MCSRETTVAINFLGGCAESISEPTHNTFFTSHHRGLSVVVRFLLPPELFQRAGSRKVVRTRLTQIHQHPTYWPIRAALAPCSSRRRSGSKNFSRVGTGCGQHIILTRLLTLHCFCRRNAYFQSMSCWCSLAWHRLPSTLFWSCPQRRPAVMRSGLGAAARQPHLPGGTEQWLGRQ